MYTGWNIFSDDSRKTKTWNSPGFATPIFLWNNSTLESNFERTSGAHLYRSGPANGRNSEIIICRTLNLWRSGWNWSLNAGNETFQKDSIIFESLSFSTILSRVLEKQKINATTVVVLFDDILDGRQHDALENILEFRDCVGVLLISVIA